MRGASAARGGSEFARTRMILTGQDAKSELGDDAGLVTEMREIKHPLKAGIKAPRGLDF